jgi:hypothetical protein
MPNLSWSFSAGATGGSIDLSGGNEVDAVISAEVALEANMQNQTSLSLQVDDVSKVVFLGVASTLQDGKVEIVADGDTVKMIGPLLLYGDGVALFAGDLSTLKVVNKSADKEATLTILVGMKLAP